ncbi:MAG: DegT/DnrJ/EryC1/StrS family aminotransferase [Kiritimatiellia bacterium]
MDKQLAIEGGAKAVKLTGSYPTKIHVDELLEVFDLWEFPTPARKTMAAIIRNSAKDIKGPHLFRYYNPRPSKVAAAEKAFGKFIGVPHCLAVNSCTSALIAAMRSLGIGMGDEVIVPAYTFFATVATVGACNAIPVIADVDDTLTLDPTRGKCPLSSHRFLHPGESPACGQSRARFRMGRMLSQHRGQHAQAGRTREAQGFVARRNARARGGNGLRYPRRGGEHGAHPALRLVQRRIFPGRPA